MRHFICLKMGVGMKVQLHVRRGEIGGRESEREEEKELDF